LHHAFSQIHPFQDGNGRIARLLASFVLIKGGLFPLSIDRGDRSKYIDALESADNHEYQPLVDVFADNQISSIERALNWKTVEYSVGYGNVLDAFNEKLTDYRATEAERQNKRILNNMNSIFEEIRRQTVRIKEDMINRFDSTTVIDLSYCAPGESSGYYYNEQIIDYANLNKYYVNLSLSKCWVGVFLKIDSTKKYRIVLSLHHYGYDNSAFALGAFLSRAIPDIEGTRSKGASSPGPKYTDISLGIPPLTISSTKDTSEMISSIRQQVEISIMAALAYIANELG